MAEELKLFVRERLAAYKHPREVVFLDTLPRTHLGKVDRGRLRKGAIGVEDDGLNGMGSHA